MRLGETVRDLNSKLDDLFDLQRSFRNPLLERLALEQLHHDERLTVIAPDIVNRADARMVQRRYGSRLPLKALQGLEIVGKFRGQELQRHKSIQLGIPGFIDDTHAAAAELFENDVLRYRLADHIATKLDS